MYFEIFVILFFIGCITISYLIEKVSNKYTKISFKESLDLVDLPIITFKVGNEKLNFMLDSGANLSVINETILPNIEHILTNKIGTIFGMEGNIQKVRYAKLTLQYKNSIYTDEMQVLNMDNSFSNLKKESGVTVHGILGNNFFQKYKYVLDFKELVAFSKI